MSRNYVAQHKKNHGSPRGQKVWTRHTFDGICPLTRARFTRGRTRALDLRCFAQRSYVICTVAKGWRGARIKRTRRRLAKRHTRREAGSQNHGSPLPGTIAGLPNQVHRTTTCSQELAALRNIEYLNWIPAVAVDWAAAAVTTKGGKDQEKQDGVIPVGNEGRRLPPLFFTP